MFSDLKIRYKIVIPVALLFVLAIAITAALSVSLLSRDLERRFQDQIAHASEMVSRTDFAFNRSILEKLKPLVGADIITFAKDGTVVAGTVDERTEDTWLEILRFPGFDGVFDPAVDPVIRDVEFRGRPYRIAYRPVQGSPDTAVAFLVDTSDIETARTAVGKPVAVVAILMIVLASSISLLVARSISRPLQRLVDRTRRLAAGERDTSVEVEGADEVGALARAFSRMTEQLRQSEDRLLRSEKLAVTGQLAARVAHDIRNPLSSIKMQAQLLREKLDAHPGPQRSVEAILKEIGRVEWVVQGLLDLARPIELRLEAASVNDVIDDALQTIGPQLKHSGVVTAKRLADGLAPVMLDRDRLKQALLNVIVNAAEAMPRGGTLLVTTQAEPARNRVVIEICDDGVGIDPATRDRLFDPFFTTKREGVGLGLVNTASIVKRHDGTIELEPREGGGTRVTIALRPAEGDATGTEVRAEAAQEPEASPTG